MKKMIFFFKQLIKSILQNIIFPIIYNLNRRNSIVNKRVVLVDTSNDVMPVDFLLLKNNLIEEDYEIIELYKNFANLGFMGKVKFVNSFYKVSSTANIIVMCNYVLPVSSCNMKKETKVIQLWHACGAYKKFGYDSIYDTPKGYHGRLARNYDLVTVSSAYCESHFSSAFDLKNGEVKSFGVSRTDLLYDEEYKKVALDKFYKMHPEAQNKKVILWAPTFRGYASNGSVVGLEEIERINDISDDYFVIMRLHSKIKKDTTLNNVDLNSIEILLVSDYLISDYSSIIFEFALLNKPIGLFIKDYEEYIDNRGFYLDFDLDLPFPKLYNFEDIKKWLLDEKEYNNYDEFNYKFTASCDGDSTSRILQYIKGNI